LQQQLSWVVLFKKRRPYQIKSFGNGCLKTKGMENIPYESGKD
jgi:hypothetical protein